MSSQAVKKWPEDSTTRPQGQRADGVDLNWPAIRAKEDGRLALPIEFVCPYCKQLIGSQISGRRICPTCGRTAHPPFFAGYGKHVSEYLAEKRHKAALNRFINQARW